MDTPRSPILAIDPLQFGRRGLTAPTIEAKPGLASDDLRLFAITFAAGFLFMAIFLG